MSSTFAAAFGRAVAAERNFLGLTQVQLGERLKWSDSTISEIESGRRTVPVAVLPEICEALECSVLTLMGRATGQDRRRLRI